MKKTLKLLLFALIAVAMASCEDDEVAQTLDGIWEGEVATEYFTHRGKVEQFQRVDIQFYADPYKYAQGMGVEYDYFQDRWGWSYEKIDFTFEVRNRIIYLDYADDSHIMIRNYSLHHNTFDGEFCDLRGNYLASFSFNKVGDWWHIRQSARSGESACREAGRYTFDN